MGLVSRQCMVLAREPQGELVTTEPPLVGNTFLALTIDLLSLKYFSDLTVVPIGLGKYLC